MSAQVGPWLWACRSPPGEAFQARADLPGRLQVEPWSGATRGAGDWYRPEP